MTRIRRSLFGGAIQAFLPNDAIDARQDESNFLCFIIRLNINK